MRFFKSINLLWYWNLKFTYQKNFKVDKINKKKKISIENLKLDFTNSRDFSTEFT